MQISRRKFIYSLGAIGVGGVFYTRFAEPQWLELTNTQVFLPKEKDKIYLKILHLSDFHASPVVSLPYIKKAIEMGVNERPDLIFLTGDFITKKYRDFKDYSAVLQLLSNTAPAYAVLGNHDGGSWAASTYGYADHILVEKMLLDSGIKLLHNGLIKTKVNGRLLHIVGLGDLWSEELKPEIAFAELKQIDAKREVVLLLSHNPDSKDLLENYPWDLMFCGHTHGGQIVVPLLGLAPFAPVRDRRFISGLYTWKNKQIFITRGVGNLHGVRFNCRPEVSIIEVKQSR